MTQIRIVKVNEAKIQIAAEKHVLQELSERFTFDVPNARFSPAFQNRFWDGKIRLLDGRTNVTYAGLANHILAYARENNLDIDDQSGITIAQEFSLKEAKDFIASLNLPMEPREYQIKAFVTAIREKRAVLLSPTSSGKSLIAYIIARFYGVKTLIVVPTVSLVSQMLKDFESYGYTEKMHGVRAGVKKTTDLDITVSTWQSIYEQKESFFKDFGLVIGDEAHLFKAKSLTKVMTNMKNTPYRIGMTGTLDGAVVHELVLTGLFGSVHRIIETSELIEQGHAAKLRVKILMLKHSKDIARALARAKTNYQGEIDYLVESEARTRFIRNLALSLSGNTLILCSYVDKHLDVLYSQIQAKKPSDTYRVSGSTDVDSREEIREIMEKSENATVVASYGVFSTGVNVKRIHNIIFASPSKSRVRVMQSIGRGLRLGEGKTECTLYDIADDLSNGNKANYTLKHLVERIKMYTESNFPYKIYTIEIKEKS